MKSLKQSRKGIAIAVVLVFCVSILGLVTILVTNTRFNKGSHVSQYEQTRALMAAKSATQLAIYKYRVLPSEFYRIHEAEKASRLNPGDPALSAKLSAFVEAWMRDLDSDQSDSPAAKIKQELDSVDNIVVKGEHSFKVEEFRLVSRKNKGYVRDFIKITAVGKFGNSQKTIEELVEVKVAH